MRWFTMTLVSCLSACSSDDGLPPPPAEATASCVFDLEADEYASTSTLWYDDRDNVIRVDGYWVSDHDVTRAPYYFEYDDDGRLVGNRSPETEYRYRYAADQIEITSRHGTEVFHLTEGRARDYEFPLEDPPEHRRRIEYRYDDAGRLTMVKGMSRYNAAESSRLTWEKRYGYDERGRLTSVAEGFRFPTTLAYEETPGQLTITVTSETQVERWSYTFDHALRLIRAARDIHADSSDDVVATYEYGDGVISQRGTDRDGSYHVTATGRCDLPTLPTRPQMPVPIRWSADYTKFIDVTQPYFPDLN